MLSDVRDFHLVFGAYVAEAPGLPDLETRYLRNRLLHEEIVEYLEAEKKNDLVETARELSDILYIICGTAVSYGLNTGRDNPTISFGWSSAPKFPSDEVRQARRADIQKHYDAYEKAETLDDLGEISNSLQNLMDAVFTCALFYSIPLLEVFKEVHNANMRKLVDGKVMRREDGKVLKPEGWSPPNIEKALFGVS